ncbi:hypothetical protein UFOVP830_38 [uncultured Caudovirales phage]|uniref:Uncharacterized protein n=1 Tax=uncultured Caudovirales phage TaxID=2100421 RepID=A0A6J5P045_9CAUD|nr:hypothetical protein UFOVP830_38 [uncultured Caudovirales phage]
MSESNRLQDKLDSIVALYEQAIELARDEGERNAYDKCEKAIRNELNWAEGEYGNGLQYALELVWGLR